MFDSSHNPDAPSAPRTEPSACAIRRQLEALVTKPRAGRSIVVVIVAHPDDEAIGPGATIATLRRSGALVVLVVIAACDPARRAETRQAARLLGLPAEHVFLVDYPDGRLIECTEPDRCSLRPFDDILRPGIVITHKTDDHPDHSVVCAAVRQVFGRGGTTLLHFRIPQPTYGSWHPTVFVRVAEDAARLKLDGLSGAYPTQSWKDYFDPARNTGILAEAGLMAGSRFAEPFEADRLDIGSCPACGGLALAHRGIGPHTGGVEDGRDSSATLVLTTSRTVLEPCRDCGALVLACREQGDAATIPRCA